jgi:DNA-binding transcriptional MerR regulator
MSLPARAAKTYTISELAREFDITPRAIRFYEDSGLLEPIRAGRNRVYSQRDRTRLKLTLRGKRLGLSLQEIRGLVTMYDTESDTAPQLQAFLAVAAAHRRQLELQLDDIRVTLAELTLHEGRCQQLLMAATAAAPSSVPLAAGSAAGAAATAPATAVPAASRRKS